MKGKSWRRRLENWEVWIACQEDGWACLADTMPEHGQKCEFAHVASDYPTYKSTGTFGCPPACSVACFGEAMGAFVSDPNYTYWRAA